MIWKMKWPIVTQMNVEKELAGVPFERVNAIVFIDHKGDPASAMYRRFRSIDAMKNILHDLAKKQKIYIHSLWQYNFEETTGIEYRLRCAYRML